jgi:uncharacterized protein YbjQ (UPF0145 family)
LWFKLIAIIFAQNTGCGRILSAPVFYKDVVRCQHQIHHHKEKSMKKTVMFSVTCVLASLVLALSSCASAPTIHANTANIQGVTANQGTAVGEVTATATITVDKNGLFKSPNTYGYIDNLGETLSVGQPTLVKTLFGFKKVVQLPGSTETAYANAVYDLIKQVGDKGGNAVANVVTKVDRVFVPKTDTTTITVTVTATAIKL